MLTLLGLYTGRSNTTFARLCAVCPDPLARAAAAPPGSLFELEQHARATGDTQVDRNF